jgi:hypothetical protein
MDLFYRRLESGSSISSALREAQERMAGDPATAHPFYWAGFVVMGDAEGTLRLPRRSTIGAQWLMVAGGAGLLWWALGRRIRAARENGNRSAPM